VPENAITLLTGPITSGKLTLAYKILCHAQQTKRESLQPVALFDLTQTTDGDYLQRCGLDLEHVLIVRDESIRVLLDLVRSRQVRAILLDHLSILRNDHAAWKHFSATLPQLNVLLKNSNCALIFLDESPAPRRSIQNNLARNELGVHQLESAARNRDFVANRSAPPHLGDGQRFQVAALGHPVALHLDLQRVRWIQEGAELRGYQARVSVLRNRFGAVGQSALIAIQFNDTVRARKTW
jgi:hypothetical protein